MQTTNLNLVNAHDQRGLKDEHDQRDLKDKHEHDLEEKNKLDLEEEDGRNFEVEHERDLDEGGGRDVEDERNQRGLEEEDSTCATERRRTIKRDPRGLERSTASVQSDTPATTAHGVVGTPGC